jgi:prevent-host-death family protein
MRMVKVRDARVGLAELIERVQGEPICLTRHGRPVAVLSGIKGTELENVVVEPSKKFWEEIERRRKSKAPRCSIEQLRKELDSRRALEMRAKRAGG